MIIFYHKITGRIYGVIGGRVHTKEELSASVEPKGIPKNDIYKKIFTLEESKLHEEKHTKWFNKMVKVDNVGNFIDLIDKPVESEIKSDSTDTLIIDLTKSLEEIKLNFSKTSRQLLAKANDNKLTFEEIGFNDRQILLNVLYEIEDIKDIHLFTNIIRVRAPFLDGLRRMYVVKDNNNIVVAAALITIRVDNFVYSLGGVTKKGRDIQAGDFLIWNLIMDAKELGYKVFDLGGIYADWADDDKKKVNEFKMRWGGKQVSKDIANRKIV